MSEVAPGVQVRVAAATVLVAVLHAGHSLRTELARTLPTLPDSRDRALLEAIVFAALRGQADFAATLERWMTRPPGRRDAPLRALLYVGFAQLQGLQLPAHAVLAATVDAARAMGRAHQAGLVNALLRRAQREGVVRTDPGNAWPVWLRTQVQTDWPEQAAGIFAASAQQAPLWLRVNRRHGTPADYRDVLAQAGISAQVVEAVPDGLRVDGSLPVTDLPGFSAGVVSVQDGSAQQVAQALAPGPGTRVLDACAAPGGKAAHLLERDPTLQLTALDVDPQRVQRMAQALTRLGLQAEVRQGDATAPGTWWDGGLFQSVLVDAPCTATGIVRRQPDVLLHRRPHDLQALQATQARLLDGVWPLLEPGGVLVYTTCSILQAENQIQMDAFLARTPDAQPDVLPAALGHEAGVGRQRLVGEQGMDGFFYARVRKGE